MGLSFIVIFILLCKIHLMNATSFTIMESLYNNLTSNHNIYLRPESDLTSATTITLDFYAINMQDINEVDGTLTMTGYFIATWTDQNMQWDPSQYGGAHYIILPQDKIWKPTLINANSADQFKMFGMSGLNAYVFHNGFITWAPGENLKFSCNIDISYFPFDVQECEMEIISWGYAPGDVNFTTAYTTVQMVSYTANSEWDLTKTSVTVGNSSVKYMFTYKRRPLFFVMNLILPILFFSVLNICVFSLPHNSGERIGFSITILLAVVVFLTIASAMLPATAEPRVPAVCVMLFIDLMMSGFILVSVIVSLWFYHKSEKSIVPGWIERIVRATCCCKKQNKVSDLDSDQTKKPLDSDDKSKGKITWEEVANVWDKFSIVLYILIFMGAVMAYVIDILIGMNKL